MKDSEYRIYMLPPTEQSTAVTDEDSDKSEDEAGMWDTLRSLFTRQPNRTPFLTGLTLMLFFQAS